ncbi:MAG: adenosine deaminase [Actinomycetota bacterium]|nr:adenosine deaminase [Actinomycetota bacterium]
MDENELRDLVRKLPKAELHLHIEGTLEPEMVFEMARRNGVWLPWASVEDLRRAYDFSDLQSFLTVYQGGGAALRTEQDFHELARAYLDRAHADGVVHAEMMFDPQMHTERGVPLAAVVEGLSAACDEARRAHGMTTSLLLSFLRDRGPEAAMRTLQAARPWLDRVAAVGLDSVEVGHPPGQFADVYAAARAEGLAAVAHAGEEGPPEYVWEALDVLQVRRIDHGVRSVEDRRLLDRLAESQVPLDVCPLSNVALKVVDEMGRHPLPALLDAGVVVTVNSDDPAYFGGYVADNYVAAALAFDLDRDTVITLARNSLRAALLEPSELDAHLARFDPV